MSLFPGFGFRLFDQTSSRLIGNLVAAARVRRLQASVVDAVRCAIEIQSGMVERNAGVPPERRIEFRAGIHLGDVVEESDGDLMGDGVNIAARLEGIAKPGTICLSEDAYRQVRARLDLAICDLGQTQLKNITEPVHVYSLEVGVPAGRQQSSGRLVLASVLVAGLIVIGGLVFYMKSFTWPASPEPSSASQAAMQMPEPQSASHTIAPLPPREAPAAPQPATRLPTPGPSVASQTNADETMWLNATSAGTSAAFNGYLKAFPAGAHAEDAQLRIADLILAAPTIRSKNFDGTWLTTLSCPSVGQTLGWSSQFPAQVKDGEYHGQKGKVGEVAWLTLDGKIEPDGTAAIFAKGLVGASAFAVGNAQSGSQYSFHVLAQFDRTGGNGRRIEGRTCNLSFVKQ